MSETDGMYEDEEFDLIVFSDTEYAREKEDKRRLRHPNLPHQSTVSSWIVEVPAGAITRGIKFIIHFVIQLDTQEIQSYPSNPVNYLPLPRVLDQLESILAFSK